MGFKEVTPKTTSRPSFDPAHLLKLFLYGYYNRIRSSRKLEQECRRNLEVQWLLQGLCPANHTTADLRKENILALKQVFKAFVDFLKGLYARAIRKGCERTQRGGEQVHLPAHRLPIHNFSVLR
jgi:transposase